MSKNKNRRKKAPVLVKLSKSHLLSELKKKMRLFVKDANVEAAYDLIPRKAIDQLFFAGMKPIAILPANDCNLAPIYLKLIKKIAYRYLKYKTISLYGNGPQISLYDYYLVGEPLRFFIRNLDLYGRNRDDIIKGFETFRQYAEKKDPAGMAAINLGHLLSGMLSSPHIGYIYFKFDFCVSDKIHPPTIFNYYYINIYNREVIKVAIDNKVRPVFRVGYPGQDKVEWASANPDKIGVKSAFQNLEIKIYIQRHALNRLNERLDCLSQQVINHSLKMNLDEFNTVTNKQGQSLIEFRLCEKKMGYLVYKYVEGIIVITTFLILTNNGTPEGEKLHDMLGIQKKDKQFLGIDKLSTFVNSDLKKDEIALNIFAEAGCADLFELPLQFMYSGVEKENVASMFVQYLELDEQEIGSEEINEITCNTY